MAKLNETIGSMSYNRLIVDNDPPADAVSVKLAAGEYQRGTVVTGTAGEELSKCAAAIGADKAAYIVCDDVTVEAGDVTLAYRTGHFNADALITDGTYEISAADKEALRKEGILLSDAMEY